MFNKDLYLCDNTENPIKQTLGDDEKLLWTGRPRLGIIIRGNDVILIPFSLMWGGFAFFWEMTVILQGAPLIFMLWGIPFVLIGIHLIFGRFFVDSRQRANTYYGITNKRIIIISGLFRQSINSIDLDTLTNLSLTEKPNGSGTIQLGPSNPWTGAFGDSSWPGIGQYRTPSLVLIENARNVYEIIQDARRSDKMN